jgi:hypothetical protein
LKIPLKIAFWACILAIFCPSRFQAFHEKTTKNLGVASPNKNLIKVVSKGFWVSLMLVIIAALVGAVAGVFFGAIFGHASANTVMCLQAVGAFLLVWGTLFVRGWEIQTWDGQTIEERVNRWIYRTLYFIGTVIIASSLTWPKA